MKHARAICDASGFEFPLRELVRQWDGALVHPSFCDRRNPQDFLRGMPERQLPYSRPEAPDVFIWPPASPDGALLLEDGSHLLLEAGGYLLLEGA